MNIHLGEHFEKLVRDEVASGRYNNASEVIRDGLRLLEDRKARKVLALTALRARIEDGYQQSLRGESTDGEEFFRKLLAGELDDAP